VAAKPVDLELTSGAAPPPVSARYSKLRLLVRLLGEPLASVEVPNVPQQLGLWALRGRCAAGLGAELWADLVSRSWVAPEQATDPLPISAVVCTRDRPENLENCLAALAVQRHPSYEVIVVDNAPSDERACGVAERYGARYVVEPTPGLDWARNRGVAEARFPLVAFTDDDARPDPEWLSALAAGFGAEDVGAVTGFVAPTELETQAQVLFEDVYGGMRKGFMLRIFSSRGRRMTYRPEIYGVGCNMAFRRALLEEMGGFDPALDTGTPTGGGGDLDAFQRIIERGAAIVYRPDAIVRHAHRRMMQGLRRQLYDNGRGYCAVLCTAFARARGLDRLLVARAVWQWLARWHLRRIYRRLLRRERLPFGLLLAELSGALAGPFFYVVSKRRARRLAEGRP
jgi:glycosyltransferase involved in cell wall biosynthesis